MKIAILNIHYIQDIASLKAIDSSSINHHDVKVVGNKTYIYYSYSVDGILPNNLTNEEKGRWVYKVINQSYHFIVDNEYDFITNNAKDLCDTNENKLIAFHINGEKLLGSATGFKDWLSLRDEIATAVEAITGSDYATYSNLSSDIRTIACYYLPNKIMDNLGVVQLIADLSGDTSLVSVRIKNFFNLAQESRDKRYAELVIYAYQKLGKIDGLKAEEGVITKNLRYKFIKRGVKRKSEDDLDGLVDWLAAIDSYISNGLKKQIEDEILTIKDATTTTDFIATCIAIVEDGTY